MRGAPSFVRYIVPFLGIIPAYAGSTPCSYRTESTDKDHPRVCGEHLTRDANARLDSGSSPRMRGAQYPNMFDFFRPGIIPAYAGSTT